MRLSATVRLLEEIRHQIKLNNPPKYHAERSSRAGQKRHGFHDPAYNERYVKE